MKLAEKLVYLRREKGLSQLKLAEMMKVSRQAISRWETGAAVPSSENLKYLRDLYGVSLDYLLDDSADASERNQGISDKPDGEMVTISDLVDGGKKGKRKIAKWLAIVLGLLGLIVVIYIMGTIYRNEDNFVHISEVQRREVESEEVPGFDLEW